MEGRTPLRPAEIWTWWVLHERHGVKKLVCVEEHTSFTVTSKREKQIQGWTRVKKEKLISGEWKSDW